MTHVPIIERMVMPLAVILNVTPVVAIAPGLTLMLGLGMSPRYVVTALIVFFPLLINSLVGLGNIDPEALDLFHTMHASRKDVLLHLRLPSSLPFLFVAARICFPLATVGAVVAEFSTSGPGTGLGSAITVAVAAMPSRPLRRHLLPGGDGSRPHDRRRAHGATPARVAPLQPIDQQGKVRFMNKLPRGVLLLCVVSLAAFGSASASTASATNSSSADLRRELCRGPSCRNGRLPLPFRL